MLTLVYGLPAITRGLATAVVDKRERKMLGMLTEREATRRVRAPPSPQPPIFRKGFFLPSGVQHSLATKIAYEQLPD